MSKIPLHGFNNLTKSLSFSLYKLHYLSNKQALGDYSTYINERFCADNLDILLTKICHVIGGNVLNVAKQDYLPQGASVTLMISEEAEPLPGTEALIAHLDKSHLCIHTYPDDSPQDGVAIFRADIELSTCGIISPLKVLNFIIEEFSADVIDIDYRVRGMTRDKQGKKLFNIENSNNKISDFLSLKTMNSFNVNEHSYNEQNLFHAKLARKQVLLANHSLNQFESDLTATEQHPINKKLAREIQPLFTSTS